jgi:hypothetical protein
MTMIASGIVQQREAPELRRHRTEALGKSRVWRVVVALTLLSARAGASGIRARLVLGWWASRPASFSLLSNPREVSQARISEVRDPAAPRPL